MAKQSASKQSISRKSKYSDQQVQSLLNDLAAVLEKHQSSVDLSFMEMGNTFTNLLQYSVGLNKQKALADAFCNALKNSLTPNQ